MPYKYKIDVDQLTNKVTYSGEMDSLNEVNVILKQVEKKLVKDETARITFTYTEINEKKAITERAKIRKIIEEEYANVMSDKKV